MVDKNKRPQPRSQRLTLAKSTPSEWFGWTGVAAMFLLVAVRVPLAKGAFYFPLLSLGEWLLLPLGAASLSMGLLSLSRIKEKTLLPLWLSAIVPAVLWLAAAAASIAINNEGQAGGDLLLSWAVHLVFPSLAFLPLLTIRVWRDRLMWALTAGIVANAAMIFWQGRSLIGLPELERLGLGGFLINQHDYALYIAAALPLIAAWRGGRTGNAFATPFCTFLLPALALAACHSVGGLVAAVVGLVVAWAAWRSYAWVLGVFLVLLIMGYGATQTAEREFKERRLLIASAAMGGDSYQKALNTFQVRPYIGTGPESYVSHEDHETVDMRRASPWYATLLGGTGLLGLGMWLVMLGELAARTMGRFGRRCLWHGGVLGAILGVGVAAVWTDALPEGAGALIGVMIALSILEEPEELPAGVQKRLQRQIRGETKRLERESAEKERDTDVVPMEST